MPTDFEGEFTFPKVLVSKSIFLNPNQIIRKIRISARYLKTNIEGNLAMEVSANAGTNFESVTLEEFELTGVGSGHVSTGERIMTNTGSEIQYRIVGVGIRVEEVEIQYNFST